MLNIGYDICYKCGKTFEYGTLKDNKEESFAIYCKKCRPDLYKMDDIINMYQPKRGEK